MKRNKNNKKAYLRKLKQEKQQEIPIFSSLKEAYEWIYKVIEQYTNKITPKSSPEDITKMITINSIYGYCNYLWNKSKPISRLTLSEYVNRYVEISGTVVLVKKFGNRTKVLLDTPCIIGVNNGTCKSVKDVKILKYKDNQYRNIDSHIWIDLDELQPSNQQTTQILAGEVINVIGKVITYKGKVKQNYQKASKHGLIDLLISDSGIRLSSGICRVPIFTKIKHPENVIIKHTKGHHYVKNPLFNDVYTEQAKKIYNNSNIKNQSQEFVRIYIVTSLFLTSILDENPYMQKVIDANDKYFKILN